MLVGSAFWYVRFVRSEHQLLEQLAALSPPEAASRIFHPSALPVRYRLPGSMALVDTTPQSAIEAAHVRIADPALVRDASVHALTVRAPTARVKRDSASAAIAAAAAAAAEVEGPIDCHSHNVSRPEVRCATDTVSQ